MRESVPTARYSPVCNVLRQWKTSLILTYRVYRLYDKRLIERLHLNTRAYISRASRSCAILDEFKMVSATVFDFFPTLKTISKAHSQAIVPLPENATALGSRIPPHAVLLHVNNTPVKLKIIFAI